MERISSAYEDYLEAIVELCDEAGSIRSVDIALKLGVSKASVNKAVKALKAAGLVEQPYYGDITLTAAGRAYGESVLERHRVLRSFLTSVLDVDPEIAEDEACQMEHAISDDTLRKWAGYLKELGVDPNANDAITNAMHQPRSLRQERNNGGA